MDIREKTPSLLLGLAGASCSGKTTLEKSLKQHFGDILTTFPFDDLHTGLDQAKSMKTSDWESPSLYRWDDYATYVRSLKSGQPTVIDARSRDSRNEGVTRRTIQPAPIVVVSGFLALHDSTINQLFDITVYIDLPDKEIIRRRLRRANPDDPWDTPSNITDGLIRGHRKYVLPQKALADYVVDGSLLPEQLADTVIRIMHPYVMNL